MSHIRCFDHVGITVADLDAPTEVPGWSCRADHEPGSPTAMVNARAAQRLPSRTPRTPGPPREPQPQPTAAAPTTQWPSTHAALTTPPPYGRPGDHAPRESRTSAMPRTRSPASPVWWTTSFARARAAPSEAARWLPVSARTGSAVETTPAATERQPSRNLLELDDVAALQRAAAGTGGFRNMRCEGTAVDTVSGSGQSRLATAGETGAGTAEHPRPPWRKTAAARARGNSVSAASNLSRWASGGNRPSSGP
jgi:hypothetical protein